MNDLTAEDWLTVARIGHELSPRCTVVEFLVFLNNKATQPEGYLRMESGRMLLHLAERLLDNS
jgi:hypothetical protein